MRKFPNRSHIAMLLAVTVAFSAMIGTATASLHSAASAAGPTGQTTRFETGIYTLESDMNFRESASKEAPILCVIPKGTIILIDQVTGVWGHTTYEGKEGWMSLEYSSVTGDVPDQFTVGKYRTDASLNFRSSAAELNNNIIGLVPGETVVTVEAVSGVWGKVTYGGKTGWISLNYCTPYVPEEEPETTEPAPNGPQTEPVTPVIQPVSSEVAVDWLVLDISRHNAVGYFDWAKIKAAGVMGVIIRVGGRGYGSEKQLYDDVSFYQHYLGAKSVGLHVGAYFFSYALTEQEAKEEAQMTIGILRSCNAQLDMPVYIDIEDYWESDHQDNQHQTAGKEVCTRVVDTFCTEIENAGYYPGVYCNKYFAETLLDDTVFAGRSLWIAHYASACGYTRNAVSMWQYGSSGNIDGYAGQYIDVNRCYINYPALIAGIARYTEHENLYPILTGGRKWETTKTATCKEDGAECIVVDGVVYAQRLVRLTHPSSSAYVSAEKDTDLSVGGRFDPDTAQGGWHSEDEAKYEELLKDVREKGGVRLYCCGDCGEILRIEHFDDGKCEHDYRNETVSAATCTAEGIARTFCTKCGKTCSEFINRKAGHTVEEMRYYEGENGSGPYYGKKCTACGQVVYRSYNFIPGDVDGNLKVEAADARLTLRNAVNLETIRTEYRKNADMNKDGKIGADDARLVLRKSVNLD
ncbi:MAG: SH3 domain-containing protein [Clostridia bacterium]|nr:SH3 domain-containing protein [Clostridia bacterium]